MKILCAMDVDEIGAHVLPIFAGSFGFFSVTFSLKCETLPSPVSQHPFNYLESDYILLK
jgi:hypothetical protein